MRNLILSSLLYTLVAAVALAQPPVPIDKEPMHRLKFANEYIRVFDVLIPAGKSSLFHTHIFDGVGVRVSNADMAEEFADGSRKTFSARWGEASFGSGPEFAHRVINTGKTDFQNIYVELLPQKKSPHTGNLPLLSEGHIILIDNPRVRVNRLVLKPGESSKPHTHSLNGLGIILYESKIEITVPDGSRRIMEPKAGDFIWQTGGTAHVIKNIGKSVFEAIDVEIK
jgi:quercetin dioxygenase-like cupin family protein